MMCSNDLTAFGAMHKLHRAGLSVPRDVSVVGFDDIHLASLMIPPLTSVQLSRNDLARAAVSALRAHVEGREPEPELQIETRLVVRESTSHPPVQVAPQTQLASLVNASLKADISAGA
jgi:LacI family transcriptional regulator